MIGFLANKGTVFHNQGHHEDSIPDDLEQAAMLIEETKFA